MTKINFDLEQAIQALRDDADLNGKDGILTPLNKQPAEAAMQGELEQHLSQDSQPNRKNGNSRKTMKSSASGFELDVPRNRAGTYDLQIVKKHQTHRVQKPHIFLS